MSELNVVTIPSHTLDQLTERQQYCRELMQRVVRLMALSTISYEVIANQAGLSPSTIMRWVDGNTLAPRLPNLLMVCHILGYELVPVKFRRYQ